MQTNESSLSNAANAADPCSSLTEQPPATPPVPPTPVPPASLPAIPAAPAVLREIKLTDIRLDTATQVRVKMNDKVVGDYVERMLAGDKFPPADVFFDGKGYYVADGFHRLLGAGRAKLTSYPCNVHLGGPERALWFGLGANTRHGLRLTSGDKRHAIEMALGQFPDKTQDQIASQVGCAQSYVAKVASELITGDKLKIAVHRKGKDGKVRPTRYRTSKRTASQKASSHASTRTSSPQPAQAQTPIKGQSDPGGTTAVNTADAEFVDNVRKDFQQWMDQWAVCDLPRVRNILIGLLQG